MTSERRIIFLLGLLGLMLSGIHTVAFVEIALRPMAGSAVHFNLPDVSTCNGYNLTDSQRNPVVNVYNRNSTSIGSKYEGRSTIMLLSNGSCLFTLHRIQISDEGTYLLQPGRDSPDSCWIKFALTVISPRTGHWLTWEPWSSCDKTCGTATRLRSRSCSIQNLCYHGDSQEVKVCEENKECETQKYEWSDWSAWSDCSVTCDSGRHDRQRYCYRIPRVRVSIEHCSGKSYENEVCSAEPCQTPRQSTAETFDYDWTNWGHWSTCSVSCGSGFKTRERRCHDTVRIIDENRCIGPPGENITCSNTNCKHDESSSTGSGKLSAGDQTVELPLSVIVGTGAGVFILVLAIVICVLVVKLRRKKAMLGIVKTGSVKRSNSAKETYKRKKESIISCSSQGVSGVHVYDEIEDVKSQRMSVLTIDNPYVAMPKSASPTGGNSDTRNGAVTYSNTQETVFVFDSSTVAGHGENRKVSNAYQNASETHTKNNLTVPRHMSVDSTGYLMPGTALERAAKRNKKYLRKT